MRIDYSSIRPLWEAFKTYGSSLGYVISRNKVAAVALGALACLSVAYKFFSSRAKAKATRPASSTTATKVASAAAATGVAASPVVARAPSEVASVLLAATPTKLASAATATGLAALPVVARAPSEVASVLLAATPAKVASEAANAGLVSPSVFRAESVLLITSPVVLKRGPLEPVYGGLINSKKADPSFVDPYGFAFHAPTGLFSYKNPRNPLGLQLVINLNVCDEVRYQEGESPAPRRPDGKKALSLLNNDDKVIFSRTFEASFSEKIGKAVVSYNSTTKVLIYEEGEMCPEFNIEGLLTQFDLSKTASRAASAEALRASLGRDLDSGIVDLGEKLLPIQMAFEGSTLYYDPLGNIFIYGDKEQRMIIDFAQSALFFFEGETLTETRVWDRPSEVRKKPRNQSRNFMEIKEEGQDFLMGPRDSATPAMGIFRDCRDKALWIHLGPRTSAGGVIKGWWIDVYNRQVISLADKQPDTPFDQLPIVTSVF